MHNALDPRITYDKYLVSRFSLHPALTCTALQFEKSQNQPISDRTHTQQQYAPAAPPTDAFPSNVLRRTHTAFYCQN